jgi:hypothetical protein
MVVSLWRAVLADVGKPSPARGRSGRGLKDFSARDNP